MIECLRELLLLEPDWDGRGGVAPSPELVESAIKFWQSVCHYCLPATDLYALNGGNIIMEWEMKEGRIIRIEVEEVGKGTLMDSSPAHMEPCTFTLIEW